MPDRNPPAIGRRQLSCGTNVVGAGFYHARLTMWRFFYRAALRSAVGGFWYGVVSTAPDLGEIVRNK